MTYPKATGQTVWQGSIICHHCAYGCSLRSLLKGALRSFTAVTRLVCAPTSAGPCAITPGGHNTPRRPSMRVWTTHTLPGKCICSGLHLFSRVIHEAPLPLQSQQPAARALCLLWWTSWGQSPLASLPNFCNIKLKARTGIYTTSCTEQAWRSMLTKWFKVQNLQPTEKASQGILSNTETFLNK